jgi:hypothetical protein
VGISNVCLLFPFVVHGAKEVLAIISASFSLLSMFGLLFFLCEFLSESGGCTVRASCVCRPSVLLKYLLGNSSDYPFLHVYLVLVMNKGPPLGAIDTKKKKKKKTPSWFSAQDL